MYTVSPTNEVGKLVEYLLERGHLSKNAAHSEQLRISVSSGRYVNYAVQGGHACDLFIKVNKVQTNRDLLSREAQIYALLWDDRRKRSGIRRFIPEFLGFEPDTGTLVLERVEHGRTIEAVISADKDIPIESAGLIGEFFALLHRDSDLAARSKEDLTLPPPWVSSLALPDVALFARFTPATHDLVRTIQRYEGLRNELGQLPRLWRPSALIHSDFKWGNVLTTGSAVKVIDWEFGGYGDPAWDVGSVIHGFCQSWLRSIPMTGTDGPARYLDHATLPFERLRPPFEAFIEAYSAGMPVDPEFILRAMKMAGARLVQSAYESTQTVNRLTPDTITSLQFGWNLLEEPAAGVAAFGGV